MQLAQIRSEIERMRRQIHRRRKDIQALQRAGICTRSAEELLAGCWPKSMSWPLSAIGRWANVASANASKARKGTNPFTKEPMMFKAKPARKIVRARPVKAAKDAV